MYRIYSEEEYFAAPEIEVPASEAAAAPVVPAGWAAGEHARWRRIGAPAALLGVLALMVVVVWDTTGSRLRADRGWADASATAQPSGSPPWTVAEQGELRRRKVAPTRFAVGVFAHVGRRRQPAQPRQPRSHEWQAAATQVAARPAGHTPATASVAQPTATAPAIAMRSPAAPTTAVPTPATSAPAAPVATATTVATPPSAPPNAATPVVAEPGAGGSATTVSTTTAPAPATPAGAGAPHATAAAAGSEFGFESGR